MLVFAFDGKITRVWSPTRSSGIRWAVSRWATIELIAFDTVLWSRPRTRRRSQCWHSNRRRRVTTTAAIEATVPHGPQAQMVEHELEALGDDVRFVGGPPSWRVGRVA